MPTRTVREIMSSPVATLAPDVTVAAAADQLSERRVGAMPVVDAAGKLLGVLSDDDLLVADGNVHVPTILYVLGAVIPLPGQMKHLEEELHKVAGSTVGEIMDADAPSVTADATIQEAATLMHDKGVTHLPVVDADHKVIGIVARGDVVRFIALTT